MAKKKTYPELHAAVESGDVGALSNAIAAAGRSKKSAANSKDANGEVPLLKAITRKQLRLLEPLIAAGAKLHPRDTYDCTLVHAAATSDQALFMELLRLEPLENWSQQEISQAFDQATMQNAVELLEILRPAAGDIDLLNTAICAALHGHAKTLSWCIQHGVNINSIVESDSQKDSLLHYAVWPVTTAVLIDAGADLNIRNQRGRTPLMCAAKGEPQRVADRVSNEEKRNVDRDEGNVIFEAAPAEPVPDGRADTAIGLLLAAGADATLVDRDGFDALAILDNEYASVLKDTRHSEDPIENIAAMAMSMIPRDVARQVWEEDGPEDALDRSLEHQGNALGRLLVSLRSGLTKAGAKGQSVEDVAVIDAIRVGDHVALRKAIEDGGSARSSILTGNGYSATTALGWTTLQEDVDCCRVLLEAGANPNDGGSEGPPLILAAGSDSPEIVRLLLNHGADPTLTHPDEDNETALDAARGAENREIVKILKEAGVPEPVANEPFKPSGDFWHDTTELLVKANASKVAQAVAKSIGGQVVEDALGKTVTAAKTRGHLIVQLDGSEWTSVLPHIGSSRIPDDNWRKLAADVSSLGLSFLMCFEDTAVVHAYYGYEAGKLIEQFEESPGEEFGDGIYESKRGREEPEDMDAGHIVFELLAQDEQFCVFISGAGGMSGGPFEFVFPGERRKIADALYVGN